MQKHQIQKLCCGVILLFMICLCFSWQEVQAGNFSAVRGLVFSPKISEPVQLVPEDGEVGDQFGRAVAVWEDTLVVGVPEANNSELADSGAVRVYNRVDEDWIQSAILSAPEPKDNSKFGTSVAVYEDLIVVGEPNRGDFFIDNGAAYVFTRNQDNTWSAGTALLPDGGVPDNSQFGGSVAIWGETIVVGAPEYSLQKGAVFVFVPDVTGWKQEGKLLPLDEDRSGLFGSSVAIWEDRVIVGAYSYKGYEGDESHIATGAAFAFQRVDGNWETPGSLIIPEGVLNGANFFGKSVAIWGPRVVVGAPSHEDGDDKAYIFEMGETSWDWVATLEHSNTLEFGTAVSLWEDQICVSDSNFGGEIGFFTKDTDAVGSAFLYQPSGDTWVLSTQLQVPGSAAYGTAVGLHQGTLVVGDTEEGSSGPASLAEKALTGSVYVYEMSADQVLYFPTFFR
jgi:hypothetical protein